MNRALWKKTILEARLLLAALAVITFAFCWLRVWIVSFLDMERFETILAQFREFERFLPVPFEQLVTYPGRIALTFEELIVVMSISVWSISRGSDAVSGELSRGTMEMLLAQPVSRWQVLWVQTVVMLVGTAILVTACWLGIFAGIHTTTVKQAIPVVGTGLEAALMLDPPTVSVPMSQKVSATLFIPPAINLFSLGFFLAGISTFMSSWDRYRWRTIGLVSGLFAVSVILKIVGLSADSLVWLKRMSFLAAYEPQFTVSTMLNEPAQAWSLWYVNSQGQVGPGPMGLNAILLGLGLAGFVAAFWIFRHRDLPAPV